MASRSFLILILAGGLISLVAMGSRAAFGLFLEPVSSDLGWGREVFGLALAIQNIVWGLSQPFASAIADKYGSGKTLLVSSLVYAAGLFLMSQTSSPTELHMSAGVMIGLGLSGTGFGVVIGSVGRAVAEEKRSMALGIVGASGSLGQFLMVPLGQAFLSGYGWSMALVLIGLCSLLMIPAAAGVTGRAEDSGSIGAASLSAAIREAAGNRSYWLLFMGFFVCGFHVTFLAVHLPAYIVDQNVAAKYGAIALSIVGLFNVIGSLSAGYLGGKYSKKYLLSGLYFARAALFVAFILVPISPLTVIIFSAILGLLWLSTVPLTSGLVAVLFGPKYMTTLFGFVFFGHQIGAFLGAWLGGFVFDLYGSYDVVWWMSVALGLISGLLHWPIQENMPVQRAAATG
ncbi:MFS transporter [uncultured Sneathiella sp.]|mgnify:FL=1|jgi:MFS family permease|uniref:MFS transporter n=1 Tax=uncultured Sneathiella sp. TaxID=879315 RepID=UPI0030D7EF7E|tara:strand:+ start:8006 stop:9205 length:1200 start_codon:yes stop_codon:yes gene_type:complete